MGAVGWNKGTGTQVDFVKPESRIENHLLVWHMKKLIVYAAQASCHTITSPQDSSESVGKGMVSTIPYFLIVCSSPTAQTAGQQQKDNSKTVTVKEQ